jgi:membrane protein DedA with SNARE-associated domain
VEGKLLAGMNFWLGLVILALTGAIGCLIGSIAAYGIGAAGGRPLMLKYGRYVLISQHDADMADHFFQKWGGATAFFSRLLPIVRTYISLPAGITKMPLVKFCVYTFLGSLLWCFLLAYVGTVVGNNLAALTPIFRSFEVVIIIALVILVALYIWRHLRNDRKARAEHASSIQQQQVPQQNQMMQQPWGQQQWGQSQQQIPQGQPIPPQQQWVQTQQQIPQNQPVQSQWGQPQQGPQWGEPQRPSQQGWVQVQSPQQPPRPPQGGTNNGLGR